MKFGTVLVADAKGVLLAHATVAGENRYKKGCLIGAEEIRALTAAGIEKIVAAIPEDNDLGENEAARRLATAFGASGIAARPPATGRVNLHAKSAGVFTVDAEAIARFNAVDPEITVATLENFTRVSAGQMVATVKIIPFAVNEKAVENAAATVDAGVTLRVHPFKPRSVGLVQSALPATKLSALDKTAKITAGRLVRSGSSISRELRAAHSESEIAGAIGSLLADSDIVLVFGASAVCDRHDVVPLAMERAGARIVRFGMPVDPGNLLVLGNASGKPVVAAPGCARSPKENGFDWVLDRLVAGLNVTANDISDMGVGGLLTEIASRPQPREAGRGANARKIDVGAVILAAGRSTRMGGPNKLLSKFEGKPLIRKVVDTVCGSNAKDPIVVTGHQAELIDAALSGAGVARAFNPDYSEGFATSLITGLDAVSQQVAGALVILGDMPGVATGDLNRMIGAFRDNGGAAVVRATHNGKRGNPVIIPRAMFGEVKKLRGDTGARHLIEANDFPVVDIEIGTAASVDVDTPETLAEAGGKF